MPGFDGTGPQGAGPITGRGRGFCFLPARRRRAVPSYPRPSGNQFFNAPRFGLGPKNGRGRNNRGRGFW
ncbi:MAG: DUF5320 domain-containing protein [Firmicutes bacterium]|nr:DUF5320 domain-containing protein [Bacillota bacterium]